MNPSQKKLKARPPDKGSFPLDHEGECKEYMLRYMKCLKDHSSDHSQCRDTAKQYLQCRMDKELMAQEQWNKLGYHDNTSTMEQSSNNIKQ